LGREMNRSARGDEGGDLAADRFGIDDHGRAADHAEAFEFFDAVGDGGAGETYLIGDLGGGRAPVAEQEADDAKVEVIQIDSHGDNMSPQRRFVTRFTYESSENAAKSKHS